MSAKKKDRPPLVVPSHGNGKLLAGGIPGHPGSGGRPPSVLRERLRGTVEERVEILERILDNPKTSAADKIRCVDVLLRYGLGAFDTVEHRFAGVIAVLQALPDEQLQRLETVDAATFTRAVEGILYPTRAREQVRQRLANLRQAMEREVEQAKQAKLPKAWRLKPEREVQPKRKLDPEAVIAEFYDGGLPKATQEPTETTEAVDETEPAPPIFRSRWPAPGRAVVTRESLRDRFI